MDSSHKVKTSPGRLCMPPSPPPMQPDKLESHSPRPRGCMHSECQGQAHRWLGLDLFPSAFSRVASTPPAPIPRIAAAQPTSHAPKLSPIRGWVGNSQGRNGVLGRWQHRPGLFLSRQMPEHRALAGVTNREVTAMILEVLGVPSHLPPGP